MCLHELGALVAEVVLVRGSVMVPAFCQDTGGVLAQSTNFFSPSKTYRMLLPFLKGSG